MLEKAKKIFGQAKYLFTFTATAIAISRIKIIQILPHLIKILPTDARITNVFTTGSIFFNRNPFMSRVSSTSLVGSVQNF